MISEMCAGAGTGLSEGGGCAVLIGRGHRGVFHLGSVGAFEGFVVSGTSRV